MNANSTLGWHGAAIAAAFMAVAACAAPVVVSTPGGGTPESRPAVEISSAPPFAADEAGGITEASIRGHMEFLASDALNGRGSGTRDEWIAAAYIASQFRQWGLEPLGDDGGFVQQIEVIRPEVTAPPRLTAGGLSMAHGGGIIVTSLGAADAAGPLVKYTEGATIQAGAAVLLPAETNASAASGAAVVLLPRTDPMRGQWASRAERMPAMPARLTGVVPDAARPATVYLDEDAHAAIAALESGVTVTVSAQTRDGEPSHTWNAVGRLTGRDPQRADEVIVLSAHLDHTGAREVPPGEDGIFNGADDDASGTVAVMELARALAAGPRPARTLVFALFGSEERGGFGASYFVDKPVVPLEQIVADLQFEMLGRPDELVPPHTLWLTGYERSDLGERLAAEGARLVIDPRPDQNFFNRSDNIRFARRGVVAHTVSSFGLHADYHRPSDEVETIDFAHMTDAIRSMLGPVRWLADSTFRPSWRAGACPPPCGR
jgi:Zn-dependent M28 family amino/carboxypeptidase